MYGIKFEDYEIEKLKKNEQVVKYKENENNL